MEQELAELRRSLELVTKRVGQLETEARERAEKNELRGEEEAQFWSKAAQRG